VAQVAAEDKSPGPGFVSKAQLGVLLGELFDELIDGIEGAANDAVTADFGGVLRAMETAMVSLWTSRPM